MLVHTVQGVHEWAGMCTSSDGTTRAGPP